MATENTILEKLEGLVPRFEEVSTLITDPNVIADQKGVTLFVRNPVSENAVVWDEYGCKTPVPMKKTAQGYEIPVGEVKAWSIKTVFFEYAGTR